MAVNNSRRPNHIKIEVKISEPGFMLAHVEVGPYVPRAGPVLPNPEAATEKMVSNDSEGIIRANPMHEATNKMTHMNNMPTTRLTCFCSTTSLFIFGTSLATRTTTDLTEGDNEYYTSAKVDARVDLQTGSNLDLSQKSTSDLTEGTNLYYTTARFDTAFSGKSTSNLPEGTKRY